jgi:hypothetical protein
MPRLAIFEITDDDHESLCWRRKKAEGRGSSIELALVQEFDDCFGKAKLSGYQMVALRYCRPHCVAIAHATVIPAIFTCVVQRVKDMHYVVRGVCMLFFKHLAKTWFGLANRPLRRLLLDIQELQELRELQDTRADFASARG